MNTIPPDRQGVPQERRVRWNSDTTKVVQAPPTILGDATNRGFIPSTMPSCLEHLQTIKLEHVKSEPVSAMQFSFRASDSEPLVKPKQEAPDDLPLVKLESEGMMDYEPTLQLKSEVPPCTTKLTKNQKRAMKRRNSALGRVRALQDPSPQRPVATAKAGTAKKKLAAVPRNAHKIQPMSNSAKPRLQAEKKRMQLEDVPRHSNGAPLRQWSTEFQRADFTIMSYSMLANSGLESHSWHPRRYFAPCLAWENRKQTLLAELEARDYSIYCLQEMDFADYVETFEPAFRARGYKGVYKKRDGFDYNDGCAIFHHSKTVKRIKEQSIRFNRAPPVDDANVGIVAIFDIVTTDERSRRICVATTSRVPALTRGLDTLGQLRCLLNCAENWIRMEGQDIPIVLCGDLGASPDSFVVSYLTSDQVDLRVMPQKAYAPVNSKSRREYVLETDLQEFCQSFEEANSTTNITLAMADCAISNHQLHNTDALLQDLSRLGLSLSPAHPSPIHPLDTTLCQAFFLEDAYLQGMTDNYQGRWNARFKTKARCVSDYIFYGHLRRTPCSGMIDQDLDVDRGAETDGKGQSGPGTTVADHRRGSRLKMVGCLLLPCELLGDWPSAIPNELNGSDHLSLVSAFDFA